MATYSTNLGLTLQTTGENPGTWGDVTNTNLGTLLEQAVSGYTTQAVTDGADTVLTITNGSGTGANNTARYMYLELTGTLTASRNVIVPANRKVYFIFNNTTGSQSVTVKVAAQTGVSVPNGKRMVLVSNGTDVVEAITYFTTFGTSAINSTPVGNTTASSGAFTTLSASSTVSGTGFSNYLATPPAIGGTTPAAGSFAALTCTSSNVSVTLSPTGTGTVTINPATAGSISNMAGSFTTLAASSTVSGTGFTNYFASPPAIGGTAPAGGRFTFAHTVPVAVTFSATAMAIDCALSNVFTTTFTANVTTAPTLSNLKDGQTINWFITQDATGTRTMTWPTSFKWPGGTAGVLSTAANAVDLVVATYRSATGFWYATIAKAFA